MRPIPGKAQQGASTVDLPDPEGPGHRGPGALARRQVQVREDRVVHAGPAGGTVPSPGRGSTSVTFTPSCCGVPHPTSLGSPGLGGRGNHRIALRTSRRVGARARSGGHAGGPASAAPPSRRPRHGRAQTRSARRRGRTWVSTSASVGRNASGSRWRQRSPRDTSRTLRGNRGRADGRIPGQERTASIWPRSSSMPVHSNTTIADSGAPTVPFTAAGRQSRRSPAQRQTSSSATRVRPRPWAVEPFCRAESSARPDRCWRVRRCSPRRWRAQVLGGGEHTGAQAQHVRWTGGPEPPARASARSTAQGALKVLTTSTASTGIRAWGRMHAVVTSAAIMTSRCAAGGIITRNTVPRSSSIPPTRRSSRASPRNGRARSARRQPRRAQTQNIRGGKSTFRVGHQTLGVAGARAAQAEESHAHDGDHQVHHGGTLARAR